MLVCGYFIECALTRVCHPAGFVAQADAGAKDPELIKADITDKSSIYDMVKSSRVVVSTVGPFDKYGEHTVAACAEFGVDYVDITGETWWVQDMQKKYADTAMRNNAAIINMCGVDSLPSDLAAMLAVRHAHATLGTGISAGTGYFTGMGGISGGTIASLGAALENPSKGRTAMDFAVCATQGMPPVSPPQSKEVRPVGGGSADSGEVISTAPNDSTTDWIAPPPELVPGTADMPIWPRWDAAAGVYQAPFVMAGVNTRVVRRSAVLYTRLGSPYHVQGGQAAPYVYSEYMPIKSFLPALFMCWAHVFFVVLLAIPPIRWGIFKYLLPSPGQGPSANVLASGWHRMVHVATPADPALVKTDTKVVATFQGGEPGYTATSAMLATCALLLATNRAQLPVSTLFGGGGFLTPASALGMPLLHALEKRGDFKATVRTVQGVRDVGPLLDMQRAPGSNPDVVPALRVGEPGHAEAHTQ